MTTDGATVPVISDITFGVFRGDEINRMAAVRITEPALYAHGLPVTNGLCDVRMGTCDRRLRCGTCYNTLAKCPGHYGAISLSYPVYHASFLDTVLKLLRCVCYFCSSLLLDDGEAAALRRSLTKDRKGRLSAIVAATKNKRGCPRCGGQSPHYFRQGLAIRTDFGRCQFQDADEQAYCGRPFTSSEARIILQNIAEGTLQFLGFDPRRVRPESFILTTMLVPPPIVRPSTASVDSSKSRGQDDLTAKLVDIVKANNNLRLLLDKEAATIPEVGLSLAAQQCLGDLAFHIASFMNNESRGQKQSYQRSGLPTKSITNRLRGKEGRIRGSLMGKRVDFSARSVVSPDSEMDIDEVGLPQRVALILTIREPVVPFNLERLRARVRCGHGRLDGAQAIERASGTVMLEFADREREASQLRPGDVVHRYLENGDPVLFNRQPSLHRGSMMGFRVRICEGNTFRSNLSTCSSFNSDFDGDEMNIHVPQESAALVEAALLMNVAQHIVSPQANKPTVGIVQDSLVGAYLLSHDNTRLSRAQIFELHALLRYPQRPAPPPPDCGPQQWSGRAAFSMLLRPDLTYHNPKAAEPVRVVGGRLLSGRLCKATLGTCSGSLVHYLWLHYGPQETTHFLSDCQRVVNRWLMWRGFSVRLSDCEPSPAIREQVLQVIDLGALRVRTIEADAEIMRSIPARAEEACATMANRLLTQVGKVVHAHLDIERNSLFHTVASGSKGNLVNIAQLIGTVGQQSLEGHRTFGEGRIPMPQESSVDVLQKNGFVRHSYFQGLEPCEFFFHAMAGREGLSDTAVKTSTTGYVQRRLVKAMETLCVQYDSTVRNSRDHIVQFAYGSDGYDASFLVKHNLSFLAASPAKLRGDFEDHEWPAFRRSLEALQRRHVGGLGELATTCYSPCRVEQHLVEAAAAVEEAGEPRAPPRWSAAEREAAAAGLERLIGALRLSPFDRHAALELLLRWQLRARAREHLAPEAVAKLLGALEEDAHRAAAAAGEAVGPIAAQGLGERFSQQCLSNFHFAGVDNATVTQGVPRIKELIDCSKNIKTPVVRAVVLPAHCGDEPLAALRACIPHFTLAQAAVDVQVLHEPDFFASCLGGEDDYVCRRERLFLARAPADASPYLLRFELHRERLAARGLTAAQAGAAVLAAAPGHTSVTWSEETMQGCFLRVRPCAADGRNAGLCKRACEELAARLLRDVTLCGIAGMREARTRREKLWLLQQDEEGHRGGLHSVDVVVLEASGNSLAALLGMPEIKADLTSSNDVGAVLATLGVEAANRVLFDEMKTTLSGEYISERHIALLCSTMTHLGYLLPISRHGLNRIPDNGPLARCSFEECIDQLFEAALFAETDGCHDVTAAIMTGQRGKVGTGMCHIRSSAPRGRPLEALPEEDEGEASDDDVVFTCVADEGAADHGRNMLLPPGALSSNAGPTERAYADASRSSAQGPMPLGAQPSARTQSFLDLPRGGGLYTYAPSSPMRPQGSRKRYAPSSPKHQT
jgi:DNA-directed RNA polymerase II subunit RPB1